MSIIAPGEAAPGFDLKDHRGELIDLQSYRGQRVVLAWHPLAWTSVCAKQMQALDTAQEALETLDAVGLGLSVDPVPSKEAWARDLGIVRTSLLSDFWPHGGTAERFGIFRKKDGFSERAVIVIDRGGIVRFAKVYPMSEVPDMEETLAALRVLEGVETPDSQGRRVS